jgi:hypothetical protein
MRKLVACLLIPLLLGDLLFISSCAAPYRPIHAPATISQSTMHETPGLEYAYQLDVLMYSRNKKYSKKEVKTGFRVVSLKITNRTSETIVVRDNVKVFIGGDQVRMTDPPLVRSQLKQIAPVYLLYSFLVMPISTCTGNNCEETVIPIGLIIGLFNMLLASSANKALERDLLIQNLIDREIAPGETATGLLCLYSVSMGSLSLELAD